MSIQKTLYSKSSALPVYSSLQSSLIRNALSSLIRGLTRRLLCLSRMGAASSTLSPRSFAQVFAHPATCFTLSSLHPASKLTQAQRLGTSSTTNFFTASETVDVPDLSHLSEPMGATYLVFPKCRAALSPFLLTDQQLASYKEDGYISNLTPAVYLARASPAHSTRLLS